MGNFSIGADTEKEMRQILTYLSLPDIINMLRVQTEDMPPEKRQFYLDEIEMWGAIGDKQQLISDIIDIAEEYVGLDEVMDIFETLTEGLPPVEAQTRYVRHDVPEGFEWSEETSPTERLKWMKYYQYPGYYSREEHQLIQPHPEQEYADPELLQREWEEGKVLGMGPIIPPALPKLEALGPEDKETLRKSMEQQILETIQPTGAPVLPRPYVMEMVYDYLYLTSPEAAEQFRIDGVASRTRFGFSTQRILRRMFNEMSLEDLYLYWNSIVIHRELPWVDTQYALDRFGGGALGKNIGDMYTNWQSDQNALMLDWPDDLPWADRVPPSEAQQWEY
jgi:hypothetical protein